MRSFIAVSSSTTRIDAMSGRFPHEPDMEHAASPRHALSLDRSAHRSDEIAHDRQAKTRPSRVASARLIGPVEAIEDALQVLRLHADASVRNSDLDTAAVEPRVNRDDPAVARVVDRVPEDRKST